MKGSRQNLYLRLAAAGCVAALSALAVERQWITGYVTMWCLAFVVAVILPRPRLTTRIRAVIRIGFAVTFLVLYTAFGMWATEPPLRSAALVVLFISPFVINYLAGDPDGPKKTSST